MHKVVVKFVDLQDSNHLYEVGDVYPRVGASPTPERIAELASNTNKLHTALIEELHEEPMKYEDTKVGKIKPVEESKEEDKEEAPIKKRKKKAE